MFPNMPLMFAGEKAGVKMRSVRRECQVRQDITVQTGDLPIVFTMVSSEESVSNETPQFQKATSQRLMEFLLIECFKGEPMIIEYDDTATFLKVRMTQGGNAAYLGIRVGRSRRIVDAANGSFREEASC